MDDKNFIKNYKRSIGLIIFGVFAGLIVVVSLRVFYYDFMGYQPNMHPGIAFFFIPIILGFLLMIMLPLELLFQRIIFAPSSKLQKFIIGLSYPTFLIWWAFPEHAWIVVAVNPLTIRYLLKLIWLKIL